MKAIETFINSGPVNARGEPRGPITSVKAYRLWVFAKHGKPLIAGTIWVNEDGKTGTIHNADYLQGYLMENLAWVACLPSKEFDSSLVCGVAVPLKYRYSSFCNLEPDIDITFRMYLFKETLWHKVCNRLIIIRDSARVALPKIMRRIHKWQKKQK